MAEDDFVEIFVNAPVEVCAERDPKGLYKKAQAGEIPNFTGVSDPYEEPESPELVIETDTATPAEAAAQVIDLLEKMGKIQSI